MAAMVMRMPTAKSVAVQSARFAVTCPCALMNPTIQRDARQMARAENNAQDAPHHRRAQRDSWGAFDGVTEIRKELFHLPVTCTRPACTPW